MASLEWMLASRYLRRLSPRSRALHGISGVFALVTVGIRLTTFLLLRFHRGGFLVSNPSLATVLHRGTFIGVAVVVLIAFFIALIRRLNIFSTISTYGLFLGTGALVVVLSVMSGFEKDLKRKILGANAHITVTTPDRPFTDYKEVRSKLSAARDVVAVSPFISAEVMLTSQSNVSGVILKGIDPTSVGSVTDLRHNLEQGDVDNLVHPEKLDDVGMDDKPTRPESPKKDDKPDLFGKDGNTVKLPEPPAPRKNTPAVIVGRELAKNLRVYLSDDVTAISPMGDIGPAGELPRSRPFRVGGVFYSGMYEYDSKYAYMSIPAAQRFLGLDDEVTGFELRVRDPDRTDVAVKDLKARLGEGFDVQAWQELNRNLFSALKIEKIAMFVVLCFIILVAGFSIVANGIMLVREKGREIAILKSMGIRDGVVLKTFLYIGLYMGGIGTVVGIASGVAACLGLRYVGLDLDSDVYYISRLPVEMNPWEIACVFGAAVLIALVATLYPALVAARLRPVDGLRYDHG